MNILTADIAIMLFLMIFKWFQWWSWNQRRRTGWYSTRCQWEGRVRLVVLYACCEIVEISLRRTMKLRLFFKRTTSWPAITVDAIHYKPKKRDGVVLRYDWLLGAIYGTGTSHLSPINIQFHVKMIYKKILTGCFYHVPQRRVIGSFVKKIGCVEVRPCPVESHLLSTSSLFLVFTIGSEITRETLCELTSDV